MKQEERMDQKNKDWVKDRGGGGVEADKEEKEKEEKKRRNGRTVVI